MLPVSATDTGIDNADKHCTLDRPVSIAGFVEISQTNPTQ